MTDELVKFRTRWRRWLGQKTRFGSPAWVTLLDSNWIGWAVQVLDDTNHIYYLKSTSRVGVRDFFAKAIDHATMQDLIRLDNLYATEKMYL